MLADGTSKEEVPGRNKTTDQLAVTQVFFNSSIVKHLAGRKYGFNFEKKLKDYANSGRNRHGHARGPGSGG